MNETTREAARISRRNLLKAGGALAVGAHLPGPWVSPAAAQAAPIKIGFQVHRTGIGAAYGRWYERTTKAAVKLINETGGIGGRPVEIVVEDDGTDPKRGAEVVEKFATQHKVDVVFGTLFSHVVIGSAPRAGELKMPYFVVSRGPSRRLRRAQPLHLPARHHRRRVQVPSMAPWIAANLGKKVTHDLPRLRLRLRPPRLSSPPAMKAQGGDVRRRRSRSRRRRARSPATSRRSRPRPR